MGTALSTKTDSSLDQLVDKRRVFVLEYLRCFNATKAAKLAGYSETNAHMEGWRLLRDEKVAAAIDEEVEKRGITREAVTVGFAEVAFGADLADFEGFLDGDKLVELRENGIDTRLLKSVAVTKTTTTKGEELVTHETRRMDIHDRMAALKELARVQRIVAPVQAQGQSQGMAVFLNIGAQKSQDEAT